MPENCLFDWIIYIFPFLWKYIDITSVYIFWTINRDTRYFPGALGCQFISCDIYLDPQLSDEDNEIVNHYIQLQAENLANRNLILTWQQGTQTKEYKIPILSKGSIVKYLVTIPTSYNPPSLVFTVREAGTKKQGKVNGQDSVSIKPRISRIMAHLKLTLGMYIHTMEKWENGLFLYFLMFILDLTRLELVFRFRKKRSLGKWRSGGSGG